MTLWQSFVASAVTHEEGRLDWSSPPHYEQMAFMGLKALVTTPGRLSKDQIL